MAYKSAAEFRRNMRRAARDPKEEAERQARLQEAYAKRDAKTRQYGDMVDLTMKLYEEERAKPQPSFKFSAGGFIDRQEHYSRLMASASAKAKEIVFGSHEDEEEIEDDEEAQAREAYRLLRRRERSFIRNRSEANWTAVLEAFEAYGIQASA